MLCLQVLEVKTCSSYSFDKNFYYNKKWWHVIECLLRNGVDVDKIILNGDSALNLACSLFNKCYRTMLIETLLREKADINISNSKYQTALIYNCLTGAEIYKLVAYKADLGAVDNLGRSVLHVAVCADNVSIVEALLECYIDTSIQDKEDDTTRFYLDCVNTTKCSDSIKSRVQILQLLDKRKLKND